jgi:hypothetical protein
LRKTAQSWNELTHRYIDESLKIVDRRVDSILSTPDDLQTLSEVPTQGVHPSFGTRVTKALAHLLAKQARNPSEHIARDGIADGRLTGREDEHEPVLIGLAQSYDRDWNGLTFRVR